MFETTILVVTMLIQSLTLSHLTCADASVSFDDTFGGQPQNVWIVVNNQGRQAKVDEIIAGDTQSYAIEFDENQTGQLTVDKVVINGETFSLPNPKTVQCGQTSNNHRVFLPIVIGR